MGDRKVPFDHVGFDQRCRDMPFSKRGAGENLAYIGGVSRNEIPKVDLKSSRRLLTDGLTLLVTGKISLGIGTFAPLQATKTLLECGISLNFSH